MFSLLKLSLLNLQRRNICTNIVSSGVKKVCLSWWLTVTIYCRSFSATLYQTVLFLHSYNIVRMERSGKPVFLTWEGSLLHVSLLVTQFKLYPMSYFCCVAYLEEFPNKSNQIQTVMVLILIWYLNWYFHLDLAASNGGFATILAPVCWHLSIFFSRLEILSLSKIISLAQNYKSKAVVSIFSNSFSHKYCLNDIT